MHLFVRVFLFLCLAFFVCLVLRDQLDLFRLPPSHRIIHFSDRVVSVRSHSVLAFDELFDIVCEPHSTFVDFLLVCDNCLSVYTWVREMDALVLGMDGLWIA